ncbi:hypothetical protein [Sphingomonas sp.]|uniref:hypothetical protein n=1 Tax=Sphingomonas sp. TaxID=28214 RepID=UPI00258BF743|nr:hypothetical protein [Sphingomonas sp.]
MAVSLRPFTFGSGQPRKHRLTRSSGDRARELCIQPRCDAGLREGYGHVGAHAGIGLWRDWKAADQWQIDLETGAGQAQEVEAAAVDATPPVSCEGHQGR